MAYLKRSKRTPSPDWGLRYLFQFDEIPPTYIGNTVRYDVWDPEAGDLIYLSDLVAVRVERTRAPYPIPITHAQYGANPFTLDLDCAVATLLLEASRDADLVATSEEANRRFRCRDVPGVFHILSGFPDNYGLAVTHPEYLGRLLLRSLPDGGVNGYGAVLLGGRKAILRVVDWDREEYRTPRRSADRLFSPLGF
jgi:hypothetical protein